MAYGLPNGHLTDDVTWRWKVKLVTPKRLERNISKTTWARDFKFGTRLCMGMMSARTKKLASCWNSSSFGVTWPSKLGCYEESTSSPLWGLFVISWRQLQNEIAEVTTRWKLYSIKAVVTELNRRIQIRGLIPTQPTVPVTRPHRKLRYRHPTWYIVAQNINLRKCYIILSINRMHTCYGHTQTNSSLVTKCFLCLFTAECDIWYVYTAASRQLPRSQLQGLWLLSHFH